MNNPNFGQAPQQPQQPQQPKAPLFNNDMLGIISAASGVAGVALGIMSVVMSDSTYALINPVVDTSSYKSAQQLASLAGVNVNLKGGVSPVWALIFSILALLLSGLAVFLGITVNAERLRSGAPRGTIPTLGMVFGCAGVLVCLIAIFVTGCSTCSYCSIKSSINSADKVAQTATNASKATSNLSALKGLL